MRPGDPAALVELHERLLFRRAYPASEAESCRCDDQLLHFPALIDNLRREGQDLSSLEASEVSGIAGTSITAVFSYGVADRLVRAHPQTLQIAWDAWDSQDSFGRLLPHLIPWIAEESLVEAHVEWERWLSAAARGQAPLAWLLRSIARRWPDPREAGDHYDGLQMPLHWEFGSGSCTRTMMRMPVKTLFCHEGPLLTRRDISLDEIPSLPPLASRPVSRRCGEIALALAVDTSAVRYRELHGFTWGDPTSVREIQAGRGVQMFLSTVPPRHRLPLRDYHAISIWKNGVPIGYFEGLSLHERMEAGFNLYYTFRSGETAWLYGQVLRVCHQFLGASCFVVHPYQLGDENQEAIQSGAFWFYRKLGFRSVDTGIQEATRREERRLAARPGARSSSALLRRLAREPMIYEFPGVPNAGQWDDFRLSRLLFRLSSGSKKRRKPARADIIRLGKP